MYTLKIFHSLCRFLAASPLWRHMPIWYPCRWLCHTGYCWAVRHKTQTLCSSCQCCLVRDTGGEVVEACSAQFSWWSLIMVKLHTSLEKVTFWFGISRAGSIHNHASAHFLLFQECVSQRCLKYKIGQNHTICQLSHLRLKSPRRWI